MPAVSRKRKGEDQDMRKGKPSATRRWNPRSAVVQGAGRNVGDRVVTFSRVYRDTEMLYPTTLVTDAGGYQGTRQLNFNAFQLPNYTDFQNLFDEYRIIKAEVTLYPRYITNTDGGSGTITGADNHLMLLGWDYDANSATVPSTTAEGPWLEREGYRQVQFTKPVKLTCYPKCNLGAYNSAVSTAYVAPGGPSPWISTANMAVPHYGASLRIYGPQLAAAMSENMCNVYVKLTIQFRQVK